MPNYHLDQIASLSSLVGRVLKVSHCFRPAHVPLTLSHHRLPQDEDALSVYKIQSSHTIHMVKGAARNTSTSTSSSAPASQQLPAMQAGQNPSDPLTLLNGYMGHGLMAGFNPFQGMGLNPNDPNMVRRFLACRPN